ncbi:MAG TPA: hypothetical protein VFL97_09350, partial [Nitrococcus sp.]|nr:hypothetical protein [Nitrococcus sp.]
VSEWGHDFRPDYLYVSRFVRERYSENLAPIHCFTATARREVVEDLCRHFREALAIELIMFDGGHARENLHYEVMQVATAEKLPLIQELLEHELKAAAGGAVVLPHAESAVRRLPVFLRISVGPARPSMPGSTRG